MSNLASCFCIKCKSGGKPFDSVSPRTRQNHEKADRLAYGRRLEYYETRGLTTEDISQPRKKSKKEEVIQPVFCNDSEDEDYGEHPEIIQVDEPVAAQLNNSEQNTDEDEEQVRQNTEPSFFPSEPIAFIFVMRINHYVQT